MCEPLTALAIGLGALATGIGVAGQVSQANAAAEQGELNKALAEMSATDSLQRGAIEEGRARGEGSKVIGQQRVALATSGVDISSGSALELFEDTRVMSELDAQTIKNNAWRDAWGYRAQGLEYQKRAEAEVGRAKMGAFSTVLGGIGDVAGGVANYQGRIRRGGGGI